jgi:hypothetical protein
MLLYYMPYVIVFLSSSPTLFLSFRVVVAWQCAEADPGGEGHGERTDAGEVGVRL